MCGLVVCRAPVALHAPLLKTLHIWKNYEHESKGGIPNLALANEELTRSASGTSIDVVPRAPACIVLVGVLIVLQIVILPIVANNPHIIQVQLV